MTHTDHTTLPKGRDIPLLLFGILGIGSSGPFIAKSSMPISSLIFWRNFLGALSMAPFALRKREWKTVEGRKAIALSSLTGVILAVTSWPSLPRCASLQLRQEQRLPRFNQYSLPYT